MYLLCGLSVPQQPFILPSALRPAFAAFQKLKRKFSAQACDASMLCTLIANLPFRSHLSRFFSQVAAGDGGKYFPSRPLFTRVLLIFLPALLYLQYARRTRVSSASSESLPRDVRSSSS